MEEKKRIWVRPLTVEKGPLKFSYTAYYEAKAGDELWTFISLKIEGNEPIKDFDSSQKMKLIKEFGPRAARAAHEEAEKPMRVPEEDTT